MKLKNIWKNRGFVVKQQVALLLLLLIGVSAVTGCSTQDSTDENAIKLKQSVMNNIVAHIDSIIADDFMRMRG